MQILHSFIERFHWRRPKLSFSGVRLADHLSILIMRDKVCSGLFFQGSKIQALERIWLKSPNTERVAFSEDIVGLERLGDCAKGRRLLFARRMKSLEEEVALQRCMKIGCHHSPSFIGSCIPRFEASNLYRHRSRIVEILKVSNVSVQDCLNYRTNNRIMIMMYPEGLMP